MRMLRTAVMLSVFLGVSAGCASHVVVHSVNEQAKKAANERQFAHEGVYYALPRTEIVVQSTLQKVEKKPGSYAAWSELLIGLEPVVKAGDGGTTFSFKSFPEVKTQGVPDPDAVFFVEVVGDWWEKRIFDLMLTEEGTLTKASGSVTDTSADLVVSFLSTAAGLAAIPSFGVVQMGGVLAEAVSDSGIVGVEALNQLPIQLAWDEASRAPYDFEQKFQISVQSFERQLSRDACKALREVYADATVGQCDFFEKLSSDKDRGDLVQLVQEDEKAFVQAWQVREQIRTLQERRAKLSVRAVSADREFIEGQNLESRLDKLDAQIDELMQTYFLGTKKTTPWTFPIQWIPETNTDLGAVETVTVFTLKQGFGVCDRDGVVLRFHAPAEMVARAPTCSGGASSCPELEAFQQATCEPVKLTVARNTDDFLELVQDTKPPGNLTTERGFRYRVPASASVSLSFKSATLVSHDVLLAQYGTIVALPTTAGGRTTKYDFSLHPATGALATFVLTTDPAVTADNFDDVGKALVGLEKSEAEQDDQLKRLQRERDIMKAYKEIQDLREELGAEDDGSP